MLHLYVMLVCKRCVPIYVHLLVWKEYTHASQYDALLFEYENCDTETNYCKCTSE